MRIAVIGAGGVGGNFGGKIARSEYNATLVARGEYLKVTRTSGLIVLSILAKKVKSRNPTPPVTIRLEIRFKQSYP